MCTSKYPVGPPRGAQRGERERQFRDKSRDKGGGGEAELSENPMFYRMKRCVKFLLKTTTFGRFVRKPYVFPNGIRDTPDLHFAAFNIEKAERRRGGGGAQDHWAARP